MSKIRSLLTLLTICFSMGIAWLAYASRSTATPTTATTLALRRSLSLSIPDVKALDHWRGITNRQLNAITAAISYL